jgi:hypothetical protein
VLWFIFFFVVRSALEEAAGESLPGYGVGVNNGGVLGVAVLLGGVLLGCFLLGLCLLGENLSPIFGEAMIAASTLFPSWGVAWEVLGSASLIGFQMGRSCLARP